MCKKLLRNSGSLNLSTKDRENVVTEIAGKYNGSLCLSNMNVSAKHIYSCDINNSRDVIKNNIIDNSSVLIEYLIVAGEKDNIYYVLYNASASLIRDIGPDNHIVSTGIYSISFELAIRVNSLYVAADIIKNDMIGEEIRTSLDDLYCDLINDNIEEDLLNEDDIVNRSSDTSGFDVMDEMLFNDSDIKK